MEDTQIIALYLSRQEAAIGETAKKYGGYINQIAYNILRCREDTEEIAADTYLARLECHPAGSSQSAEALSVPDHPESGL